MLEKLNELIANSRDIESIQKLMKSKGGLPELQKMILDFVEAGFGITEVSHEGIGEGEYRVRSGKGMDFVFEYNPKTGKITKAYVQGERKKEGKDREVEQAHKSQ